MKRVIVAAAALLVLAGCDVGGKQAALDARIQELTQQRDKEAGVVQHLDEYKANAVRLHEDIAKLGVWLPDTDAKTILLATSGAAGRCATVSYRKEFDITPVVTLSGSGFPEEAVACLDHFASSQKNMVLRRLTVGDHEWTAEIVLRGWGDDAIERPEPTVPPPSAFELPGTRAKREQIAKLEQQIAEYDRLIGDGAVKSYEHDSATLQRGLDLVAKEPDRLLHAQSFWNAGWAGVDAPLASGTLEFGYDGKAKLHGPLRKGVDAAKLAEIASKRHLEVELIDDSGATLTGTYTPPKGF